MRFLILLILGLVLTGCGTTHSKKHRKDEFIAPIQHVLQARLDIRTIISHPPQTDAELARIASMDPNALMFRTHDFAQRLAEIPLTDCPADFKDAFANYVTAWQERAAANPDLEILVKGEQPQTNVTEATAAAQTQMTWEAVQAVCAKYGVLAN